MLYQIRFNRRGDSLSRPYDSSDVIPALAKHARQRYMRESTNVFVSKM